MRGVGSAEARCHLFEGIYENLKHGPKQAICMEKTLETSWVDQKVGWGNASGNHQGGANSVSQVDGVSNLAPPCQLCGFVGGGLRKVKMASASPFVWKQAVLPVLTLTVHFLPVCF